MERGKTAASYSNSASLPGKLSVTEFHNSSEKQQRGLSILALARTRAAAGSVGAQRHQGTGRHQLQKHSDTWGQTSPRLVHQLMDHPGHHHLSIEKSNSRQP